MIRSEPQATTWLRVQGLYPAIMRTCQQLHYEGYTALYGSNTFRFTSLASMCSRWSRSRHYTVGGKTNPMRSLLVRFEYIEPSLRSKFVSEEVVEAVITTMRYPHLFANLQILTIDASEWGLTGRTPSTRLNHLSLLWEKLYCIFPNTKIFDFVGQLRHTRLRYQPLITPYHWGPYLHPDMFIARAGAADTLRQTSKDAMASIDLNHVVDGLKSLCFRTAASHNYQSRVDLARGTLRTQRGSYFMRLPPELRIMVYNQILIANTTIINPHSFILAKRSTLPAISGVSSRLMSTCRTIRNETRPILYGKNTFFFTSGFALKEFGLAIGNVCRDLIKSMVFYVRQWIPRDGPFGSRVLSSTWISPSHSSELSFLALRRLVIDISPLYQARYNGDTPPIHPDLIAAFASLVGRGKLDTLLVSGDCAEDSKRILDRTLLKPKDAPHNLWEPNSGRRLRATVSSRNCWRRSFTAGIRSTTRACTAMDATLNVAFGVGRQQQPTNNSNELVGASEPVRAGWRDINDLADRVATL